MNQVHLLMEIVFNNEHTFKDISCEETIKLLLTTKQAANNQNICRAKMKYKVIGMHNRLFYTIEDGCYMTQYAKNQQESARSCAIFDEAAMIADNIAQLCHSDEEFKDCMARLVMAKYKEGIFVMINSCYGTKMTDFMFCAYEDYVVKRLALCDPRKHVHDPTHYIFKGCNSYNFYDKVEIFGRSMLKMMDQYNANNEEDEDDDV